MSRTFPASRKRVFLITLTLLIAAGALALTGPLRHAYAAALLLTDLAALETWLPDFRPDFHRSEVSYEGDAGTGVADLYLPDEPARAGLVLVPGAAEDGRRDARLVEFAGAVARSGFAVLVPDIPSFRELRPSPRSAREIAEGVLRLRREEALPERGRLGIGAFSIASGPAVLAALDSPAGRQVDFLLLVGGYHDLERTLAFMTTGYTEYDGQTVRRQPDEYGKWVYALSNAGRLADPADREALTAMARRKLVDPAADISAWRARLGPDGRAVLGLIDNTDPARVLGLLEGLPAEVRSDLLALDLARRDLSRLHAEVILVHGLDDDIIPYTESMSLAAALPPGQSRLFLLKGLHHVDRDVSGADAWQMWRAVRAMLRQRDRKSA